MATVDAEKKLQNRVLHWLVDDLGYTYLGNLEDIDNTPVKEELLKANLKKRGYTDDQIKTAISELVGRVNNQSDTLYQINRSVYSLLRYGRQGAKDANGHRQTVHYIDWDDIGKNDFFVAEEVSVLRFDKVTRKRPDVVLYINGIALGVFELKSSYVSAGKGIRQLLQNQKRENILNFFSTAQFLFAGNEAEGLFYGTINTPEKYYLKWKEDKKATDDLSAKIKLLQVKEVNRLRDGVVSLCQKERFLSLVHDFVIYDAGIKKVTRHNQYFANIAARKRIQDGEGGIIWNTQGSGKSLIMVWLTKWIIENINDSRVVIITDRDELDDQIESLFIDVEEKVRRAKSCADLRSILDKNEDAIVCSLIHKYGHNAGSQSDIDQYRKELLKDLPKDFKAKGNIIAFIDECHRTNSGKLHEAVKVLMPDATSDLSQESEEEYKKKIYERMLDGEKLAEFEKRVKEQFKDEPAQMKLLIVVDKLLTGFDAPSATYLYIDKSMRDHDLFQAICRVNRPDGEDKDYGYIVDYMDLFRNVQLAVADYTSEAFDGYDKEDVDGLIKNRYDEAKSELEGTLASLEALIENVPAPQADTDFIEYFCGEDSEDDEKTARRDTLYALTASLSRSFANCCDRLVTDYGYTEDDVNHLRGEISGYNKIKEMIKLASCDYIDLKPYEVDMRYILDTYIRAEDTRVVSELGNMSIVELLLQGKTTTPVDLVKDLPGNDEAKAETIDNNLQHEIIKKMSSNSVYYGKLSEMLKKIIMQRKVEAMSYEEYLRQVVELAEAILHPETNGSYPDEIKDSAARRALYDYFEENVELTIDVDGAIRVSIQPDWKRNFQKQQKIRLAIYRKLLLHMYTEDRATEETNNVFDIVQRQEEYDA